MIEDHKRLMELLSAYDDSVVSLHAVGRDGWITVVLETSASGNRKRQCSLDNWNRELFLSSYLLVLAWPAVRLLYDLRHLSYMNETSLLDFITFVGLVRRQGGEVVLSNLGPSCRKQFDAIGYSAVLDALQTTNREPKAKSFTVVADGHIVSWYREYRATLDRVSSPWSAPSRATIDRLLEGYVSTVIQALRDD